MVQTLETIRRMNSAVDEEMVLIERLISRQGVTETEALRLVDAHKRGLAAEIDPVMLEGLSTL